MSSLQDSLEMILDQMIEMQEKKTLKVACEVHPNLTPEDIRNPQDFNDLYLDPVFNYEDGILTGYLSVRTAFRNEVKKLSDTESD
ncbi:MAG: hypothetical protein HQM14_02650 [SAR324 cluster bacterium]|nr:hypothetical protein [SAR324 cluster bacterium]